MFFSGNAFSREILSPISMISYGILMYSGSYDEMHSFPGIFFEPTPEITGYNFEFTLLVCVYIYAV